MTDKKKISLMVTRKNYDQMKAVLDAGGVKFSDFIDMMLYQYIQVLEKTNLTNKEPKDWTMQDVSNLFQAFALDDLEEDSDSEKDGKNVSNNFESDD